MSKEPISEVVRRGVERALPERPKVLVVAGYDQSAGAGLLSDIKTLEAHGVYGYGVCTGFTFQNERMISRVEWFTKKDIFEQIDLCFGSAVFGWVKIGVTPSMGMAASIIDHIWQHNRDVGRTPKARSSIASSSSFGPPTQANCAGSTITWQVAQASEPPQVPGMATPF